MLPAANFERNGFHTRYSNLEGLPSAPITKYYKLMLMIIKNNNTKRLNSILLYYSA